MAPLNERDLEAVLDLSLEAQACPSVAAFPQQLIPRLRRLVPCDSIGYNELDLRTGTGWAETDPPDARFDGIEQAFMRTVHQHPVATRQQRGDPNAYMLSDFLTAREFHSLELYHDVYRRLDTEDQIAFGLPGKVMVAVALSRARRSFTERDRDVLDALRPHLALAYSQVIERDRANALIAALDAGLERHDAAVIQLDALGRVAHLSAPARELLAAYGVSLPRGARLPAVLKDRARGARGSLVLDGPRGRLRVQLLKGRDRWPAIVLEERRAAPPSLESLEELGLTRRQAQVLRLLSTGKRNQQIAHELLISKHTVRKHLEHVYAQLGVTSRAEAIARALP